MKKKIDFYKELFLISFEEVENIFRILDSIEKGIYNEDEIRLLGKNGLLICLFEKKYELFKSLVSPFEFTCNGNVFYKYLLDPISLGVVDSIKDLSTSIDEAYAKFCNKIELNALFDGVEPIFPPMEEVRERLIYLDEKVKTELLNVIYTLDKDKIMSIRIKDMLAREISGMGHPIRSLCDVIHYAEHSVVYACIDLFNKNIITTANDTPGCFDDGPTDNCSANIIIHYDSLDKYNKNVVSVLIEKGFARFSEDRSYVGTGKNLIIEVKCSANDTILSVNQKMMEIVSLFHKQDMIFGQLTLDEVCDKLNYYYRFVSNDNAYIICDILEKGYTFENVGKVLEYFEDCPIIYDSSEGKFWKEQYYYLKHLEYLEDKPNFGSFEMMV